MIPMTNGMHAPDPSAQPAGGAERRAGDRRVSIAEYRLFARALMMRRAFGKDTALAMMGRMNIGAERAQEILAIGIERRLRRRRAFECAPAGDRPPYPGAAASKSATLA